MRAHRVGLAWEWTPSGGTVAVSQERQKDALEWERCTSEPWEALMETGQRRLLSSSIS